MTSVNSSHDSSQVFRGPGVRTTPLTSTHKHAALPLARTDGRSSTRCVRVFACEISGACVYEQYSQAALYPQLSAVANDWSQGGCWEEECRNWNRRWRLCRNVCGSCELRSEGGWADLYSHEYQWLTQSCWWSFNCHPAALRPSLYHYICFLAREQLTVNIVI